MNHHERAREHRHVNRLLVQALSDHEAGHYAAALVQAACAVARLARMASERDTRAILELVTTKRD
jgi:hypothetical protein